MVLASFGQTTKTNSISRDSLEEFVNREFISIIIEHLNVPLYQVAKRYKI
jgi:hypothetical protein